MLEKTVHFTCGDSLATFGGNFFEVLYREPASTAFAVARTTQLTIWLGALLVGAVAVGALFWLSQRLGRLVTEPVLAAGAIASRVAGGDLSVTVATHRAEATEVAELMSSVHSMVVALRRLVGAIRAAADEADESRNGLPTQLTSNRPLFFTRLRNVPATL